MCLGRESGRFCNLPEQLRERAGVVCQIESVLHCLPVGLGRSRKETLILIQSRDYLRQCHGVIKSYQSSVDAVLDPDLCSRRCH